MKKLNGKRNLKYRTQMRSIGDILGVIKEGGRDGVIVSVIGRRANLSHYPAIKKCELLTCAGLIESAVKDRNKVFTITEKGLQFIDEYQNFQVLIESLNLRY